MKSASALATLMLMFTGGAAWAQSSNDCPLLPASSTLQWEQQKQSDFVLCKAVSQDGRTVLNLMLTGRNPDLALARALRAEKGRFAGEDFYWYLMDTGEGKSEQDLRRISTVKLDKDRYAQIWISPETAQELSEVQNLTSVLSVGNSALADAASSR